MTFANLTLTIFIYTLVKSPNDINLILYAFKGHFSLERAALLMCRTTKLCCSMNPQNLEYVEKGGFGAPKKDVRIDYFHEMFGRKDMLTLMIYMLTLILLHNYFHSSHNMIGIYSFHCVHCHS